MKTTSLVFILLLILPSLLKGQDPYDTTKKMIKNAMSISEMYIEMVKKERIDDEIITEEFHMKMKYDPFTIYSKKVDDPGKQPELLYRDGWNSNKAFIYPGGFPWINISMDPKGSIMRRNQHHTLYESGFRYALSILDHLFNKYGEDVRKMASMKTPANVNGVDCYIVEFKNNYFKTLNYTVKENENLISIAEKFKISEYKILEYNDDVDDYDDVNPGQVIVISNDYSMKTTLAIDKERMIPIRMKVFDEKGLFEQLDFKNVLLYPTFREEEFTENFPGYGF